MGGEDFGRGYGPYEIAGDTGVAGTIQLQYGAPGRRTWLESYQAYVFVDAGAVWENDRHVENDHSSFVSSGVGVDLNFRPDLAGTLIVAVPLTRDPSTLDNPNDRYPRIFARLTKRF